MTPAPSAPFEPQSEASNLPARNRRGKIWLLIFLSSTIVGIIALTTLLFTIINQSAGYAAMVFKVDPSSLLPEGKTLEEMTCTEIELILEENVSKNRFKTIQAEKSFDERTQEECLDLLIYDVIQPTAKETWLLLESVKDKAAIDARMAEKYPDGELVFKVWLSKEFVTASQSDDPLQAGIRTGILGSLYIILIVIAVAFPVGIAAAIYLEEYASQSWINRVISTNINNLAGVPSIIYGMLGLALFVRVLEPITSGAVFGTVDPTTANGRTILSAGLTLALLILPVIIINSQEAIKAVPASLREASYGMGATKWQTIWYHILPYAIPGILTGTILSVSRAFGETAPLVVIGASAYIVKDPTGIFSKFTTVPIQIYQWTARPQDAYKNIAAAAIIVLLLLLLSLNAVAILLRNRFSRRYV